MGVREAIDPLSPPFGFLSGLGLHDHEFVQASSNRYCRKGMKLVKEATEVLEVHLATFYFFAFRLFNVGNKCEKQPSTNMEARHTNRKQGRT